MAFLCSRSQFWGVYSAGLGCEYRNVLTVLWVTAARCSANLVLRAAVARQCFAPLSQPDIRSSIAGFPSSDI